MKTTENFISLSGLTKYLDGLKILGIIFIGYAVLMSIPWNFSGFSTNIDDAFRVALHKAFASRMQFGKDFIYTYGPYGFLHTNIYFPETYKYLISAQTFVGIAVGAGLFRLALHCWKQNQWSVIFLVPFIAFFPNTGLSDSQDSFHIIVLSLPLLLYFYVNKSYLSPILLLTVVAAALTSLIKHTCLILAVTFMLLITFDEVFRRRRFPVILTTYLICILGFWLLAGQDPANFSAYLVNSSQIVSGYGATMGLTGPLSEILLYLISVGTFLSLVTVGTWQYRSRIDLLPIAGLLLIFFLTFKGSFIRHDGHAELAAFTVVPVACLFSALLWLDIHRFSIRISKVNTKIPIFLISWILIIANSSIIFHHYKNRVYGQYYLDAIGKIGNSSIAAFQLIENKQELLSSTTSLEKILSENPMPPMSGTTDLYPDATTVIFAYDLPYKPRPIIQSFSAYTGKLAELNAAHLRDSDAPETILFDVRTIDGRLPSSDDGLSWPELLTRYDITDMTGKFLVLKRRANSYSYSLTPLSQQRVKMGDWVELSDKSKSGAIWMQLDARPTFLGKLMTTLFKLPPLYLEAELAGGQSERYRVLADIMNSGQLLSPLVKDRGDFIYLASPVWREVLQNSAVKRMRLVAKGWASLSYPRHYSLSLSNLEFPRQDLSQVAGWSDYEDFVLLKSGKVFNAENRGLETRVGPDGKTVFLAHAETKIVVSLPEGSQKLSIGYGILDGAWQEAKERGSTYDGVEFRVLAIYPNGREEVLFSQWIDPHLNVSDRREKTAEIDLKDISTRKIALETLRGPKQDSSWDWSYWSKVKAK